MSGGGPSVTKLRIMRIDQEKVSLFKGHWKLRFGALRGEWMIRASIDRGGDLVAAGKEKE